MQKFSWIDGCLLMKGMISRKSEVSHRLKAQQRLLQMYLITKSHSDKFAHNDVLLLQELIMNSREHVLVTFSTFFYYICAADTGRKVIRVCSRTDTQIFVIDPQILKLKIIALRSSFGQINVPLTSLAYFFRLKCSFITRKKVQRQITDVSISVRLRTTNKINRRTQQRLLSIFQIMSNISMSGSAWLTITQSN